jgi:hypothetical protein
MATPVDSLLAEYRDGGWSYVQDLPLKKATETLHLDFSEKRNPKNAQLDDDDRRQLSKALSGFANSDGGLFVWGVAAKRPAPDEMDCAVGVKPIADVLRFVAELASITPELVSPVPEGVIHIPIVSASAAGDGCAITVVPASDSTPHMATGRNLHSYWHRVGDRFEHMEHHEVADMFGRRPHPVLEVSPYWELQTDPITKRPQVVVHFPIQNVGRGLARFPCLTLGKPPEDIWHVGATTDVTGVVGPFRKVAPPKGWLARFQGSGDDVLFPGDNYDFAWVSVQPAPAADWFTLDIDYEVIAAHAELQQATYTVHLSEVTMALPIFASSGRYLSMDHPSRRARA